jgi:uncharacterized protein (TIGR03435 family)
MRFAICLFLFLPAAPAQSPAFDVASVKPSAPISGDSYVINLGTARNGEVSLSNATLTDCIKFAYGLVSDDQVDGPAWIKSKEARFDILAKAPKTLSRDQLLLLLRGLLAERFHLSMHTEPRRLSHLVLTIAKGGPMLREVTPDPAGPRNTYRAGFIAHNQISMLTLAMLLSRQLREMVLDQTGLKGFYEIQLEWTPQPLGPAPAADLPDGPGIFTAIQQQLGLKLESRKDEVDVWIIDRADRVPVEN